MHCFVHVSPPAPQPCHVGFYLLFVQHLALFNFADEICWESPLISGELSRICLYLYGFVVSIVQEVC